MDEKEKKDYEEAAKRAILNEEDNLTEEDKENVSVSKVVSEKEYRSLGKAQNPKFKKPELDDETRAVSERYGYVDIKLENLPSKGRFYPIDTKISIRAAKVQEIKHFSTIEETNLWDVDDKLNSILIACTRVDFGERKASYKDILEEDRIYVILSIRELTFVKGENKMTLKGVCDSCDFENSYELKTTNLQYFDENEKIEKYYDEVNRQYTVLTKSVGTIEMSPPTIGIMKVITDYIREKEEKKEKWDKSFIQLLPYMVKDWRGFDKKVIFDYQVDFQGWSLTKFNVIYGLAEKMRVGVKQEMIHPCENCGAEVTVPISFPGGIKALFVSIELDDELL